MAVLSLSMSVHTLKSKLSKIAVALSEDGNLITAKDLKTVGAMALLMKDAMKPNLVQTLEGQPVFVHTGPFANVSHGNSSLIATQMALKLANYVVTESGFASDLGLEKLFDVVCREGNMKPSVVVLVVSVKALKSHAGENIGLKKYSEVFKEGFLNVERHIHNVRQFGVEPVVAINRFPEDTEEELKAVKDYLQSIHVEYALSEVVRYGGRGGVELAEKVLKVISDKPSRFKYLYELDAPAEEKISRVATALYGASGVTYLENAKEDLDLIHRLKLDTLQVMIAKKPYSLSDDPHLKGAPSGWKLKVRGLRACTGAGFLVVLAGAMMLMPGLPAKPMLEDMDLTDDGQPKGLF